MNACPTGIDIPLFIREILTGNPIGAAKTIFDQNILGGMCARVCPTETLCEEACVREVAEGKPVQIGQLQRYATDTAMAADKQFYTRAAPTGKRIAVVGAGPAGLACAHRLAMHGHDVMIFDARPKPGGLNEYGIAAYKTRRRLRPGRGRLHPVDRRHRDRERQGARPRLQLADLRAAMTRCSSASALPASTRCAPTARMPPASRTRSTISPTFARPTIWRAAGRPPRGGHRRRHDRHRCRRPVEAPRRRGRHHLSTAAARSR